MHGPLEDHPTLVEGGDPPRVEDYLLHPVNLRSAKRLKAGESLSHADAAVSVSWSEETRRSLDAWLRSGDIKALEDLVRANWMAVAHPAVFWQLYHLSRVAHRRDEADVQEDGCVSGDARVGPAGSRKAATKELRRLLTSLCEALLPRYAVKFIERKPRGRRADTRYHSELVMEFQALKEKLVEKPFALLRREGQTEEGFIAQVARVVQDLHVGSWRSYYFPSASMQKLASKPLEPAVSQRIAQAAVRKTGITQNGLVYALLAHYEGTTPDTIRGIIERTPNPYKTARRRPSSPRAR